MYTAVTPAHSASLESFIYDLLWKYGPSKSAGRYYFEKCSSELTKLNLLPYSRGGSSRYSDRLHSFSLTIIRGGYYTNSCFPYTVYLWYSLPTERFSVTFHLDCFELRGNTHLIPLDSFYPVSCMLFFFDRCYFLSPHMFVCG